MGVVLVTLFTVALLSGLTATVAVVASWRPFFQWRVALANEGLLPPVWEMTWRPSALASQLRVFFYVFSPPSRLAASAAEQWRLKARRWLGLALASLGTFLLSALLATVLSLFASGNVYG